ncbi:MAG: hypothetical protein EZS28_021936 [Streblomastix strix]|uniref:Uncharacterized protein n=1 Tax=Streblomastix strix TaxID=222440 RepID=A0A5J4VJH7_9EUKA|nr:MAG: hypothetical protein EZS28_021936 [Streblomastix strix]
MNVLDPPAIVVKLEIQQLDQQAGQPLPVPENQPAKSDVDLPFMKNLLNQKARTPDEQQHYKKTLLCSFLFHVLIYLLIEMFVAIIFDKLNERSEYIWNVCD